MNFQLLNIVIYNSEGDKRTIGLNPGSLNIITGASKTGKTALIEIIDFCLGTKKSNIPEGVITKYVEWVGLKIQVEDGQIFVARQLPKDSQTRSNVIYYDIQSEIEVPEYGKLEKVVNREALVKLLTKHIGIRENLHIPPEGHTRDPLSATIRHALFFVFQQQSEIISNKHLFHSQSEQFIPQTIKDVLPYFLGAVDDDYVSKQSELRQLKRKLKKKNRKLQELEGIADGGLSKAQSLL
jgi:AAA15 family ATPase/GTPase